MQLHSLSRSPAIACFSDFDGTVTDEDSNDFMIDNMGMGRLARRELLLKVLNEGLPFREAFRAMIASVAANYSFPECCAKVKEANIKLDPGFKAFYEFVRAKGIPFVLISSGMTPIIRSIVGTLIGKEEASKITIIANDVDIWDESGSAGNWGVKFRHPDSPFGHDKDVAISDFKAQDPNIITFFCGDGLSDMSAARSATMREGSGDDLAAHCEKEDIPFEGFRNFHEVRKSVEAVLDGRIQASDLCAGRAGGTIVS
ncbi:HAD-like domain-containing protein [Collybia nuda]|uniref:HAD-like domain-containing protein n=1 Tax=Collybia nuda TaxID=64659 RepID=A0A9P5Y607_9AGAR|nr:HAD-like domain-containing protein [Collybia nuda]